MALRKIICFHLDELDDWVASLTVGQATRATHAAVDGASLVMTRKGARRILAASTNARNAKAATEKTGERTV